LVHIEDTSALDAVDISWSSPKPAECLSIFYAWVKWAGKVRRRRHTDIHKMLKN